MSIDDAAAHRRLDTALGDQSRPMVASLERQIARLVQAAWRQRFWLIAPLLVMIPLSFFIALSVPQKFVARSLILFQEADPENPLISRSTTVGDRMQDRIAGMRALLRSENVLARVVDEAATGETLSFAEKTDRVMKLRSALELDNVGNNLLEFRMTGSPAKGLGSQLDLVIKHFLEGYRAASPYRTPERIVTIDRPADPVRAARGRSVVFMVGLLAGVVIAVLLAAFFELTDDRLHSADDIERVSGLPVVTKLPTISWPSRYKAYE